MALQKRQDKAEEMQIEMLKQGEATFWIVGQSPLLTNRVSEKAKRELLGANKKTKAEQRATLKKDPYCEFEDSFERFDDPKAPTLIAFLGSAFKRAITDVAVDIEGAVKAEIGRLTYVVEDKVPVWGVPVIRSAVVRNSDINRTPDIRTIAAIPAWATRISVRFTMPKINIKVLTNLLGNAGNTIGIGDGRPQKGKLAFGRFRVAVESDPELKLIMKHGRSAQLQAIKARDFFDSDSRELVTWFYDELERRGKSDLSNASGVGGNGKHRKAGDRMEVLA